MKPRFYRDSRLFYALEAQGAWWPSRSLEPLPVHSLIGGGFGSHAFANAIFFKKVLA